MIKKLAGQTLVYGVTTVVSRFINYMLAPYLTRIMTQGEYGVMNYYYGLIPVGFTILSLGLETGYFRFVRKAETEGERNDLYSTVFTTITYLSLIFFAVAYMFSEQIYDNLLRGNDIGVEIFVVIAASLISTDAILSVLYARLRYEMKARRFMVTKIFNVTVNLLICIFFYSYLPNHHDGVLGFMWIENFGAGYVFVSNLIASLLTILILFPELTRVRLHIDFKLLKSLLKFSLPLLLGGLVAVVNEFADRQLLASMLPKGTNVDSLGLYTSALKLASLMYLFTQMYRYAAEPFFLSNVKEKDFKTSNAEALKYFTIVSIFIFLFVTLYLDLFERFLGKNFREGVFLVPILLLYNMLMGIYLNLSFWYKITERTKVAVIIAFSGFVVNISANVVLIPIMGYPGSAWSRLLCGIVMVGMSYFLNQKYYPIKYDLKSIFKYALLGAVIYFVSQISGIENVVIRNVFNTILLLLFILFFMQQEHINLRYIKNNFNKFKKR